MKSNQFTTMATLTLLILSIWLVATCTPITPGEGKPQIDVASGSINVTQAAHLEQTIEIDIGVFDPTAAAPYPSAATVTDSAVIAEIVDLLDQELPIGPAAACMEVFRLRFKLSDGSVQEFDYLCEPDGSVLSNDSVSDLKGKSVQAPAELALIIRGQIP